jgi:hypothetical protein
MAKCVKAKELVITTADKPGMLAEVTSLMADNNINITAICAYSMENKAIFMLLTGDNKKAASAAASKGWKTEEKEVVVVDLPDKVGAAREIGDNLKAKNISLSYCYGTTCACATDCACRMVMSSDNNDAIIAALK